MYWQHCTTASVCLLTSLSVVPSRPVHAFPDPGIRLTVWMSARKRIARGTRGFPGCSPRLSYMDPLETNMCWDDTVRLGSEAATEQKERCSLEDC